MVKIKYQRRFNNHSKYFHIPFLKQKYNHNNNNNNNNNKKNFSQNQNKNLNSIYIYNLPENLINYEILYKYEYLGQYGNIIKIIIFNDCCYVKFSNEYEAAISLLSLNNSVIYSNLIKVGYYRKNNNSAYFNFNLNFNLNFNNNLNNLNLNFNNNFNKKSDFEISIEKTDLFNENIKKKLFQNSLDKRTIFPSPYEIYNKTEFIEYQIKMGYFNIKNNNIFKFKEVEKSRFNFDLITCNTEEEKIENDSIDDFDEINTLIMKEIKTKI